MSISEKIGRLGNRLHTFSRVISCALENNYTVMNPGFFRYADLFQTTSEDIFCRYPPKKSFFGGSKILRKFLYILVEWLIPRIGTVFKNKYLASIVLIPHTKELLLDSPDFFRSIKNKKIVFLWGFAFRNKVWQEKYADEVRSYFRPVDKYKENIIAPINYLRKSSVIIIGVSIRHGDYRTYEGGRYFYTTDTYVGIMAKIENLFPATKIGFLICSDEQKDVSKFSQFNYIFRVGEPIENLYSLAQCDYIISPPSSFSQWASFYGKVPFYVIKDPTADISLSDFKTKRSI
jgi:hypothetical protein